MMAARFNGRKLRWNEDGFEIAPRFWRELPRPQNPSFKNKTPGGGNRRAFSNTLFQMNLTSKTTNVPDGLTHIRKKLALDRYLRGDASPAETQRTFFRNPKWRDA
jgi:hypothetical protein